MNPPNSPATVRSERLRQHRTLDEIAEGAETDTTRVPAGWWSAADQNAGVSWTTGDAAGRALLWRAPAGDTRTATFTPARFQPHAAADDAPTYAGFLETGGLTMPPACPWLSPLDALRFACDTHGSAHVRLDDASDAIVIKGNGDTFPARWATVLTSRGPLIPMDPTAHAWSWVDLDRLRRYRAMLDTLAAAPPLDDDF
mgnify:CR=1 FL=1